MSFRPVLFKYFTLSISIWIWLYYCASAQEQLGLRIENYSGINGIPINPAWNATTPYFWDVNLAAAGFFAENNYGYLEQTSVLQLLNSNFNLVSKPDLEGQPPQNGVIVADYFRTNREKFAYVSQFIEGPSAMFRVKDHTFGITTGVRTVSAVNGFPISLGYYQLQGVLDGEEFQIQPFDASAMAWGELGLNYSRKLMEVYPSAIFVGGTLKLLQGYDGGWVDHNGTTTVRAEPGDSVSIRDFNLSYGFSTNLEFDPGTGDVSYKWKGNGRGFSLDLGIVYLMKDNGDLPYRFKLGVSILDIGKIRFGRNAQDNFLFRDSSLVVDLQDFQSVQTDDDLVALLSQLVYDDPAFSQRSDHFSLWMPGAISLQADVAVSANVFINTLILRRLSFGGRAIERSNLVAFTPRVEWSWVGFSLPVVLFNDKDLRFGASLRIGPLSLGSDNIPGLFTSQNQLTGTDFYMAIKVNPFVNLNARRKGKPGKGGKVKCYSF